jgi:hypothetical protein
VIRLNRQELLEQINSLVTDKKIPHYVVMTEGFTELQEYRYLKDEFDKNKIKGEKWHQIVRFALSDPKERKYMYNRLLELLLIYRRSYTDYFEIKTEPATTPLPDRLAYLNRLSLLHKEYFEIYRNIKNKIHFDYPSKKSIEVLIRGRVDWRCISRRFPTTMPINFDTLKWIREFHTPENILLILAAIWISRESKRLLKLRFTEPLNQKEVIMLNKIINNIRELQKSFPFIELLIGSRKYAHLSMDDKRVLQVESQSLYRIKHGLIKEPHDYSKLIKWIRKFRELNIRMVSASLTNFPLDTLANLDVIYEAWIFFEIINVVAQKYGLISLQMKKKPYYFEFEFDNHRIKFIYEQKFELGGEYAWAMTSTPDFTAMVGEKIIAIFDAKNYGKDSEQKTDSKKTMLAYITNLDTNFGALFFPEFEYDEFVYPRKNNSAKYHFNLKLAHYKMQPRDSEEAIAITNKMISNMLYEVTSKI